MSADYIKAWADVVGAIAWPIAAIVAATLFRRSFAALLGRTNQVKLTFLDHEIVVQANQGADEVKQILLEIQESVSGLGPRHLDTFQRVRASDGRRTVGDLFPGFTRDTEEHLLLQELRDRKLLRPFEGGSWRAERHPVVTRFATLVLRVNPNALGTGDSQRISTTGAHKAGAAIIDVPARG